MTAGREFIERIRREDYLIDVELTPQVEKGAQSLRSKLNKALRLLSEDLYSKETHFVLELVQNADDNSYPAEGLPTLTFRLSADRIAVTNNEVGFGPENVVALCSVGESTKATRAGFIGEKGIGFKSVFTVSDKPEIHSNGFHFYFDRSDPTHLLGYVVPQWCSNESDEHSPGTTIVLPAKAGKRFTGETLAELSDDLLLFLRKLRRVDIVDELSGTSRAHGRSDSRQFVSLTSRIVGPGNGPVVSTVRNFKHCRHTFSSSHIQEEKRPDVGESEVVLAFPVKDDGSADAESTHQAFAFLPIRDFGFRFLLHGDFLLSASRQDIHRDRPWNELIRDEIAQAFASALPEFKEDDALSRSFLRFAPRRSDVTDPFFKVAADQIVAKLKNAECVLSASGRWSKPSEVLIADEDFRDLFPNDELSRLLALEYLSDEMQLPVQTLEILGVAQAGVGHLVGLLEKDDRLASKSAEWFSGLYRYCSRRITQESWLKKFRGIHAIRLDEKHLARMSDGEVFFPLERGRKCGFEKELRVLDADVLSAGSEGAGDIQDFLSKLGVKKSSPYSLIVSHILPRHGSESWKTSDVRALVGHIRYVKEHLPEYLRATAANGDGREAALGRLKEGLYVQTKKVVEKTTYFSRPSELYLGYEYQSEPLIERLLGARADAAKFVAPVYLQPRPTNEVSDDDNGDTRAWSEFFFAIGVNTRPTVKVTAGPGSATDYEAGVELDILLRSDDPGIRRTIVTMLDQHWAYYGNFVEARTAVRRSYVTTGPSRLLTALRGSVAPTRKRGSIALSASYLDVESVRAVFGGSVAYLDAEISNTSFMEAVGITHRVNSAACIKRLDELRVSTRFSTKDVKLIYRELERLFDREGPLVQQAFGESPRIYVPSAGSWFKTEEVVWESSGDLLDSLYPALETPYREYQTFFCRRIGVSHHPTEAALVQALQSVAEYGESPEQRRQEAFKIYRRLSRRLRAERATDPSYDPDWLLRLKTEPLFLDHVGRPVDVSNDLYIDDDLRLADAFRTHEQVSLLAVDRGHLPQIEDLVEACGIPRLSSAATYRLAGAEKPTVDIELTKRIRTRRSEIMRVVYARSHALFERDIKGGVWNAFLSLEVKRPEVLSIEATIAGHAAPVPTDTYRDGTTIYLLAGTRASLDKISLELCMFLGARQDLADTIYRVLSAPSSEDLQDFFELKGVPEIPEDELRELERVRRGPPPISEDSARSGTQTPGEEDQGSEDSNEQRQLREDDIRTLEPAESGRPEARDSQELEETPDGPEISGTAARAPATKTTDQDELTSRAVLGGPATPSPQRRATQTTPERKQTSGRLLSYAESQAHKKDDRTDPDDGQQSDRLEIARAAVAFTLDLERRDGHEVEEMPFTNEGFDIRRIRADGTEEFIEVKGLGGPWTEAGVALTPPELRLAERQRDRYWLYVVEFAADATRQRLYRIQDPFGKTTQFRFDSGWRSLVANDVVDAIQPSPGVRVSIPELGSGVILSVKEAGSLRRLQVRLDSGDEVHKVFDPARMRLTRS